MCIGVCGPCGARLFSTAQQIVGPSDGWITEHRSKLGGSCCRYLDQSHDAMRHKQSNERATVCEEEIRKQKGGSGRRLEKKVDGG
jgi:hypothetical protein